MYVALVVLTLPQLSVLSTHTNMEAMLTHCTERLVNGFTGNKRAITAAVGIFFYPVIISVVCKNMSETALWWFSVLRLANNTK